MAARRASDFWVTTSSDRRRVPIPDLSLSRSYRTQNLVRSSRVHKRAARRIGDRRTGVPHRTTRQNDDSPSNRGSAARGWALVPRRLAGSGATWRWTALFRRVRIFCSVVSGDRQPRGRPRKWPSEAERKRAYRRRRAAELAGHQAVRDQARSLRAEATDARRAAERTKQQAEHWRLRAERAERRVE